MSGDIVATVRVLLAIKWMEARPGHSSSHKN